FTLAAISTHILVSVVGTSTQAFTLIFAAFAISLGAAAAMAARLSRRENEVPLRRTLLASAVAIAATLLFRCDLPYSLRGLGAVVPFLFLVIPTAAIGAALPLGSAAIAGGKQLDGRTRKRRLGLLYAANAVCGALGALAGAYAALPALDASTFV